MFAASTSDKLSLFSTADLQQMLVERTLPLNGVICRRQLRKTFSTSLDDQNLARLNGEGS